MIIKPNPTPLYVRNFEERERERSCVDINKYVKYDFFFPFLPSSVLPPYPIVLEVVVQLFSDKSSTTTISPCTDPKQINKKQYY